MINDRPTLQSGLLKTAFLIGILLSLVGNRLNAQCSTPPDPTGHADTSFCAIDVALVGDLVLDQDSILWFDADTLGTMFSELDTLVSGMYYASQYSLSGVDTCESVNRLMVTVTIADPPRPDADGFQSFCKMDSLTVADISVSGLGAITWYAGWTATTPLPMDSLLIDGQDYYATQIIDNCESALRRQVIVSLNDDAPEVSSPLTICAIDSLTIEDLASLGDGIEGDLTWYGSWTLPDVIPPGTLLADSVFYYASMTTDGCESVTRSRVRVYVSNPSPLVDIDAQEFCAIDDPLVAHLSPGVDSIRWYSSLTGSAPLPDLTPLVSGVYYAAHWDGLCEGSERLAVSVTVLEPATPIGEANQAFCIADSHTLNDLDIGPGASTFHWYDAPFGGNQLDPSDVLVDGVSYYVALFDGTCEGERLEINVAIIEEAYAGADSDGAYCESGETFDLVTLLDGNADEFGTFFDQAGTELASTILNPEELDSEQQYSYVSTILGCGSDTAFLSISVTPLPVLGISSDLDVCENEDLQVSADSLHCSEINWSASEGSFSDSNSVITQFSPPSGPTTVILTLHGTGVEACSAVNTSEEIIVAVFPSPFLNSFSELQCDDEPVVLDLEDTQSCTYEWSSGMSGNIQVTESTAIIPSANTGTLTLDFVSEHGCFSTQTIHPLFISYPDLSYSLIGAEDVSTSPASFCQGGEGIGIDASGAAEYDWVLPASLEGTVSGGIQEFLDLETIDSDDLAEITLTGDSIRDGIVCRSEILIPIQATKTKCEIDSIYRFPGNVFIAVMGNPVEGESSFFQWVDSSTPPQVDSIPIFVLNDSHVLPVDIEASYYSRGVCPCDMRDAIQESDIGDGPKSIKLFPNPLHKGDLTIIIPELLLEESVHLKLFDLQGQILFEEDRLILESEIRLTLPELEYGTYSIELRSAHHVVTEKLMVR